MNRSVFSYADEPFGSTVLLNQQALDAAAESLERKKLTLLPSSTHELLIAPEHISPRELQATVYEINRMGVVTPGEMLSDCIYRYDPLKKEMERFDGICWQADVTEKKYARNRSLEKKRPDDYEMEFLPEIMERKEVNRSRLCNKLLASILHVL